ncbi:TolC family protein [Geomesophilobacter sediminis]|uniref:TolC family protein n=1 Tax=Geomesophilobacter sediminis TaxID=2798584 RepID=A0A8J7M091_9BACT|nr:TolC family protein [Geomesophilobacter sediminis]MBJ6723957.1 TolC family protein [Geomesophilobacter sediminis]
MKMNRFFAALAVAPALLLGTAAAQAQEGTVNLKLRDAIKSAVEKNLDVKVELYNPAMAEADIWRALGIYDPGLNLSLNYSRTNSFFGPGLGPFRTDTLEFQGGVSQLLSTGGTAGVNANSAWNTSSSDYYTNNVNFTFSQPLLKNFGKETTELAINVAKYSKEGAMDRFRTKLSDVVNQVRKDYFTLYSLRQNLEVQRAAYNFALRNLTDTQGRVKAGVLPAIEILSAEVAVATQEKNIIDAEKALRDQMDVLRLELQIPGTDDIVPVDPPTEEPFAVAEKDAVVRALGQRPELVNQRVAVTINDLQQRVARNRTQPDLSLNANVGAGSYDNSFGGGVRKVFTVDAPAWGVGLTFSYPLGNHTAENDYIKSKLLLEQSQTQLQNLEASVSNEVRTAIRALASNYKQIDVTKREVAAAKANLDAYQKKNAVGLATTKEVFDVLRAYVAAQGDEITAVVNYNNSLTQLWRSTGEILDRVGIQVTQREAGQLYEKKK